MTIPNKFQVFDEPLQISETTIGALLPILSSYHKLMEEIPYLEPIDLQRLILIELSTRQRWKLLRRLLMRLNRINARNLERRVRQCLPTSPNAKSKKK